MLDAVEEGSNLDAVYLDYAKAFDKVDHAILAHKLSKVGIRGKLAEWLTSFVKERKQQVKVGKKLSEEAEVVSGVPQGTVLGPLLFLIFINDISEGLDPETNIGLFADDTRVSRMVETEEDVEMLQRELNSVYDWQESNNMLFNASKFELVRIGKNEELKNNTSYFTPNMSDVIDRTESVRDLGIILDDDMTFSSHINKMKASLKQKSGWLLRSIHSRDLSHMRRLWKVYALPIMDYCSPLWFSPNTPTIVRELGETQYFFMRKARGLENENYWNILRRPIYYLCKEEWRDSQ